MVTRHPYYVLAGQTPVLVHNSDCPRTPTRARGKPLDINTPNKPATIEGRDYTGYALDRMQANDMTVITDTTSGRVITVDYGRIRQ